MQPGPPRRNPGGGRRRPKAVKEKVGWADGLAPSIRFSGLVVWVVEGGCRRNARVAAIAPTGQISNPRAIHPSIDACAALAATSCCRFTAEPTPTRGFPAEPHHRSEVPLNPLPAEAGCAAPPPVGDMCAAAHSVQSSCQLLLPRLPGPISPSQARTDFWTSALLGPGRILMANRARSANKGHASKVAGASLFRKSSSARPDKAWIWESLARCTCD